MPPPILFVTSYSPDLYKVSGRRLLESFRVVRQPGVMLACYESNKGGVEPAFDMQPYVYYNLNTDKFLQDWLHLNKDVIPKDMGGDTEICNCPGANERHGREHKTGCHWHWMNRNASRWFRKVASLRYAVDVAEKLKTPWLVWVDADDVFIKPIPLTYLEDKLKGVSLFHFRGHRQATESGIVGYHLRQGGKEFIDELCKRYTSRDYLKYERWDDGYQIGKLIDEGFAPQGARDLVHPTKWKGKTEDVIPTTDIRQYLIHDKGRHGQYLNLMR